MYNSIPEWNSSAVLPPIRPGNDGTDADRSPYQVSLTDVVERFGVSGERRQILRGLIKYRQELYALGINTGFQWLDGSFVEHIEDIEARPPNDIDVVTFFYLPNSLNQQDFASKAGDLFDREKVKEKFLVDAYLCLLGEPMGTTEVKKVSYWYSIWSHRRNGVWKGFIQINMDKDEDKAGMSLLNPA